jgi:probable addiction module antidote protein
MAERLTNYDPAEDLGSDEAIAVFMAEAFQTNDVGYISHALGVVARAKGMAQIASQTGLSREQLYRSFSAKGESDPENDARGHESPGSRTDREDSNHRMRRRPATIS